MTEVSAWTVLNESNSNSTSGEMAREGVFAHIAFGIITSLSLVGNILICVVVLRRRRLLRKPYNILILNLAITDLLTGIFLAITPDFLIPERFFLVSVSLAGEVFCRLIASTYALFIFCKASTLTVMCMAIERWYAVVRPVQYKVTFQTRRVCMYIATVWLFSCATQINELFQTKVRDSRCILAVPPYGAQIARILTVVHIGITFFLPVLVTWVTFAHVCSSMGKSRVSFQSHNKGNSAYYVTKKRLVRMCAMTALLLTLCWFPAEVFFILRQFDILVLPHGFYQFTDVLAMFNSCVNPAIYCLSNQEYRRDFLDLFRRDRVEMIPSCRKTTLTLSPDDTRHRRATFTQSPDDNRHRRATLLSVDDNRHRRATFTQSPDDNRHRRATFTQSPDDNRHSRATLLSVDDDRHRRSAAVICQSHCLSIDKKGGP
ncbi:predicted protein [Nematostella vectensis]|uniref:G-protein coupled receptors family 1 profile domain-containing protein n=2 Tax=Nematostella vectensis TaxID=45351 RepID=A7RK50_NEMVE|nr:predicted protein [Nematostella vectensis]|eukprot:XP_001640168.1 predicted protein [Nematostella vectensis]